MCDYTCKIDWVFLFLWPPSFILYILVLITLIKGRKTEFKGSFFKLSMVLGVADLAMLCHIWLIKFAKWGYWREAYLSSGDILASYMALGIWVLLWTERFGVLLLTINRYMIIVLDMEEGASSACDKCCQLDHFKNASTVEINPDTPQQQARFVALQTGKTVLVPTPRLLSGLFNQLILPPNANNQMIKTISTWKGVRDYSKPISLEDKVKVDAIIIGSVAVSPKGHRIGKGEGYADLEYAVMCIMEAVDESIPVITTVHDCQVFGQIPDSLFDPEIDLPVDVICTPSRIIECDGSLTKPKVIVWSKLSKDKMASIPILQKLREIQRKIGIDVSLAD